MQPYRQNRNRIIHDTDKLKRLEEYNTELLKDEQQYNTKLTYIKCQETKRKIINSRIFDRIERDIGNTQFGLFNNLKSEEHYSSYKDWFKRVEMSTNLYTWSN